MKLKRIKDNNNLKDNSETTDNVNIKDISITIDNNTTIFSIEIPKEKISQQKFSQSPKSNNLTINKKTILLKNRNHQTINNNNPNQIKNLLKNKSAIKPFLIKNDVYTSKILDSAIPAIKSNTNYYPQYRKTVFSKISENIYKKNNLRLKTKFDLLDDDEENDIDYNLLTQEINLNKYLYKDYKKNQTIVTNFIKRKDKEIVYKKLNINPKSNFNEIIRNQTMRNSKKPKNKKNFSEFLENQNNFDKKRREHLQKNEEIQKRRIESTILATPKISINSYNIALNLNRYNKEKDIYTLLYEERINKNKNKYFDKEKNFYYTMQLNNKKNYNNQIKNKSQKLYNEYKQRNYNKKQKELNEIEKYKTLSKTKIMNKNSDQITSKRFLNKYKYFLKEYFDKNIEDVFEINYNEFLILLNKINFTTKNLNKDISPILLRDNELLLAQSAWKLITKKNVLDKEIKASSKIILIFILSVLGIIKNFNDSFIQKEYPFLIQSNINNFDNNIINRIYKNFYLFRNNAINYIYHNERNLKVITNMKRKINKNLVFIPKLAKSSYKFNNNLYNSSHHLSVVKNYDTYTKNKILKIKKYEKIKANLELKNCTFSPNNFSHRPKIINNLKSHSKIENTENRVKQYIKNNSKENLSKMFTYNPLQNDLKVIEKIEKLENNRNFKNMQKNILENGLIEKRRYKNYADDIKKFYSNTSNTKETKKYIFEINVKGENKKLSFWNGEVYGNVINNFCEKYGLDEEDKKQIFDYVTKKLNN